MSSAALPAPAHCFALIVDGLCRAIAAWGAKNRATGPVIILAWTKLRRSALQFAVLAAKFHAGALPAQRRSRPASRSDEKSRRSRDPFTGSKPGIDSPPHAGPRPRLPRTFGWLLHLIPGAACYRGQLVHFLSDPEKAALLAVPQIARLLRPLCHMLGVQLPKPPPRQDPVEPAQVPLPLPSNIATPPSPVPPAGLSREADQGRGEGDYSPPTFLSNTRPAKA